MTRKTKAWIGDAILADYARSWCVAHFPIWPCAMASTICSNINLAGYAHEILMEPSWGGTDMEAYIFDLRESRGPEAAQELVEAICVWTVARMHAARHYVPLPPSQEIFIARKLKNKLDPVPLDEVKSLS